MTEGSCQLRCDGNQKGLVLTVELPGNLLLNHQHTNDLAIVDDGHTKERVKQLLVGLWKVMEVRVR